MLLCSGAKVVCVFSNRKRRQFVAQHQLCGACGCMSASPTGRQASRSTKAHLEGYKMLIDLKATLHQSNLNPERPDACMLPWLSSIDGEQFSKDQGYDFDEQDQQVYVAQDDLENDDFPEGY
ncbi:uncharacterized protein [Miscanthus floridulus]|uniref:uncharacterized protein isoform X2 n=1 Tax=Miscanthus floridulus TaxID=154761 RepID=UPI00345A4568